MKLNEWQLLALVIGAFAAVIVVDIVLQYNSNAEFRHNFPLQPNAIFARSRAGEMVQQEMAPFTAAPPTFAEEESSSEENNV